MRELVTTVLDALGLLLVAAGAAGALWQYISVGALAPAGAIVLLGSWAATR